MSTAVVFLALVFGAGALSCGEASARAEENLLSVEAISESYGVIREQRLVDGRVPAEGAPVDDFTAALFNSADAFVTFDLGAVVAVAAVQLVSVADLAIVTWSADGVLFEPLATEAAGELGAMSVRVGGKPGLRVRYLRLGVRPGMQKAAVAEFMAFAEKPEVFPVALRFQDPPTYDATVAGLMARERRNRLVSFAVALTAIPLLIALSKMAGLRRQALAVGLAFAGVFCWLGVTAIHEDREFLHPWEILHYYLGPKYFEELGYRELYRGLAAHERERGRGFMVDREEFRDLDDYQVYPGTWTATAAGACRADFDAERWADFGADADRIRHLFRYQHLHEALTDHGYNATPLQTVVLEALSNTISPTRTQLLAVAILDLSLVVLGVAAMWWAFGPVAGAGAALLVGLAHPWCLEWTGGSIGRYVWFASLCCGLSLLHRKRPYWGGFLIAMAGLFRLFPLVFLGGLGLHALWALVRRQADRQTRRLILGVLTALLLGLAIPAAVYGPQVYGAFIENSRVHGALPPANHLGLGVLCSAGQEDNLLALDSGAGARTALFLREAVWGAGLLAGVALLLIGVRKRLPLWQLVPLASPLLFASIPLTNYDYVWSIVLVPLAVCSAYRIILLFGFVAITGVLPEILSTATAEHAALSALFLIVLILLFVDVLRSSRSNNPDSHTHAAKT